jgi:hypothetical protein
MILQIFSLKCRLTSECYSSRNKFFFSCGSDTIKPSIEMKIVLLSFSLSEYDEGSRMPFIDMNLKGWKLSFHEYFFGG